MPAVRQTTSGVVDTTTGVAETVAIPDSEANQKLIHRWVLDDVNGTVEDSVGSSNGSVNGVQSVSGNYAGGAAGDGDGSSDHILTDTWGSFGSSMTSDFAIALSVETVSTATRLVALGGIDLNPSNGQQLLSRLNENQTGDIDFRLRDANGNSIHVQTGDVGSNDGSPHRIVLNKTSNSAAGLEIWRDQSQDSVSTVTDQNFSSVEDFDIAVPLFAQTNDGTIGEYFDGVIDDICIFGDSLTQAEIQSYDDPWS